MARPHRLEAKDAALSRQKPEFESRWGHLETQVLPRIPPPRFLTGVYSVLSPIADVPGGLVPVSTGPFTPGRKVEGQPRKRSAGDHADATSPHRAPQHLVGCRHICALWALG
jgi:hypothetical protein